MINKYKIAIEGKNPDYFINELIKNSIYIYDLKKEYKKLIIVISLDDYNKLKKIKTSYKFYIIDSYGVIKIKYLCKKYLFFLICIFLGICLNIFLSKLIFDVEVIHSDKYIRELVYNNLKEKGIYKYKFKVSYLEKEKIIKEILRKETDDIEWLEIEEIGTKYIVKVEQRKKNKEEEVCSARNIVARKDAFILEIHADIGEVVKKKYDYVKKGDIVISGIIHNKEEEVSKRCATGKIYGEVWYKVNLEIPIFYKEEIITGKDRNSLEINFLNKNISFFNDFKTYKKNSEFLIGSSLLPISLNFTKYLETNVKEYEYSLSNVDNYALELASKKIKTKLGTRGEVVSKKVLKKSIKKSKIIIEVFVKVKEDITDSVEIIESKE